MSPAMPATSTTARPSHSQALRQRRESQRPFLARSSTAKGNANPDTMEDSAAQGDERPYVITQEYILRKFNGSSPSMRVYLYTTHFRINDSQESLSYSSPMTELIAHIKSKTVPHNMLDEFYRKGVKFYENCLIIEVHDFKTGGASLKDNTNNVSNVKGGDPFSVHNHNDYITPSPFVPFPQKSPAKDNQANGQTKGSEVKEEKEVDKENMPAPGQPASSQKPPAKARIATVVLFPTPQSLNMDLQLMARTPLTDIQTYRRNQQAGRNQENPPTPLTAVPPTPTVPVGRSPKRQKMVLDDTNAYEIEAEILIATAPKLYLEPTKSFAESLALIDSMTHPNNKQPAPARQSRKRTTAELAADEADAADAQRYMLAGDDFQASKTGTAPGQEEGQAQLRSGGGNFSRFKTLETIKRHHEENERRKKEEEARQQQAKRQAHAEHEALKKREEAARQAEQAAILQQQRQEAMLRQQREQQEQIRAAAHAQQMAAAAQSTQTPQSATQPQFSSPVVRQGTPMAAAASPHLTTQPPHSLGGTPMVATSSNHGAGSPPRPPSAVSHPIVRTESQSRPSRTGTPQMIQGTPVMNAAIPSRNISSTPQPPRMPQGSPTMPMQGGTPIMMQNQPGQNMTPEQINHMRAAQMGNNGMRMQPGMQIGQNTIQQLQQMAINKARQHIQQQGVPNGQNMNQYQQMLAQQYFVQLQQAQQRSAQHNNIPNMSPGQGMPGGNAGMPNQGQGAMNPANMSYQQLKATYIQRNQQLVQSYGSVQAAPPQHQQMMQTLQIAIRKKEAEMQQAQVAGAQVTGGMNPGMTAMGNMGQTPQQMQQWQAAVTQQRLQQQHQQAAQQARQQQLLMQQRQQMAANGQMNANMMGNMGMMNPGQMNMNMQNMQGMGQMNMGNVQNMQAMQNMPGMQGMNMAQMSQQQIQMMLMRQQQQQQMRAGQQQQSQQQRGPQGDGGIDWSGVSG